MWLDFLVVELVLIFWGFVLLGKTGDFYFLFLIPRGAKPGLVSCRAENYMQKSCGDIKNEFMTVQNMAFNIANLGVKVPGPECLSFFWGESNLGVILVIIRDGIIIPLKKQVMQHIF